MARKITPAQIKAVSKYESAHYDKIQLRVPKDGTRDAIKAFAERNGESLNGCILRILHEAMQKAED